LSIFEPLDRFPDLKLLHADRLSVCARLQEALVVFRACLECLSRFLNLDTIEWTKLSSIQINYASAHDNETLFDIIMLKVARHVSLEERLRLNHLATSIIALSQVRGKRREATQTGVAGRSTYSAFHTIPLKTLHDPPPKEKYPLKRVWWICP
jgi:hypothetical protein